nr:uncharacterized protein LOC127339874 [Lolium perenne]
MPTPLLAHPSMLHLVKRVHHTSLSLLDTLLDIFVHPDTPEDATPRRASDVHARARACTANATVHASPRRSVPSPDPLSRHESRRNTGNTKDTLTWPTRARRRRRRRHNPAASAPVRAIARPSYASPYRAINAPRTAMTSPTSCIPSSLLRCCGPTTPPLTSPAPRSTSSAYKRRAHPPHLSTPLDFPPSSEPPRTLSPQHCAPPPLNCTIAARAPPQKPPELEATPGPATCSRSTTVVNNLRLPRRRPSPESLLAADPMLRRASSSPLVDDNDDPPPFDLLLI